MTTQEHEIPIDLFKSRRGFTSETLERCFGFSLPEFTRSASGSEALTSKKPLDLVCDNIEIYYGADGKPVHVVIVEIQRQKDLKKTYTWPLYLYKARLEFKCPVTLIVVCFDERTATWAGTPIYSGHPGLTFAPLVMGPDEIQKAAKAADSKFAAEFSLLEMITDNTRPTITDETINRFTEVLAPLPIDLAITYAEYAQALLSKEARMVLEKIMATEAYPYQARYKSRFFQEGEQKGKAEGKAEGLLKHAKESVLIALNERGFSVTADIEDRIATCDDLDQLNQWLRNAIAAPTVEDVFRDH